MFGSSSTIRILDAAMNSPSRTSAARAARDSSRRRSPGHGLDRQSDGERTALLRNALHRDISAMGLRDVAHQREPKPGAFGVVHQRVAAAVELLEDLVLLGGSDSNAVIGYFQFYASVRAIEAYADVFLVLRIFQRVVHQIEQRTRNRFAVHVHGRAIRGDLFLKGKTVLLDLEAVSLERGSHQLAQVGFLELVFLAAGFDARKIQNIVDESAETFAFFANDAEVFLVFFLGGEAAEFESFGVEADQRQRGAKFMRNVGDEVRLEARQVHFAGHVAVGHVHAAGHQERKRTQNDVVVAQELGADRVNRRAGILDSQNHA